LTGHGRAGAWMTGRSQIRDSAGTGCRPAGMPALIFGRLRLLALLTHVRRWTVAGVVAGSVAQVASGLGAAVVLRLHFPPLAVPI